MADNYRELSTVELDEIFGGDGDAWLRDAGERMGKAFAEPVEFLAVNSPDSSGACALAKIGRP